MINLSTVEDTQNNRPILFNVLPINSFAQEESINELLNDIESLETELLSMKHLDDNKDEIYSFSIPHFNIFSRIELKSHFNGFQKELIDSFPDINYEENEKHPIDIEIESMAGIPEIDSKLQNLEKQRLLYELQQKIYEEKMAIQTQHHKKMYEFFDKPYTIPIDISKLDFLENNENFVEDFDWIPKLDDWNTKKKDNKDSSEKLNQVELV